MTRKKSPKVGQPCSPTSKIQIFSAPYSPGSECQLFPQVGQMASVALGFTFLHANIYTKNLHLLPCDPLCEAKTPGPGALPAHRHPSLSHWTENWELSPVPTPKQGERPPWSTLRSVCTAVSLTQEMQGNRLVTSGSLCQAGLCPSAMRSAAKEQETALQCHSPCVSYVIRGPKLEQRLSDATRVHLLSTCLLCHS